MSTKVAEKLSVEAKRLIKAPRERVFQARTTPDEILKWFGRETCHPLSAKMDLRVGGEYQIRIRSEEMGEMEVVGVFREVKRPSRLVYTWRWPDGPMKEETLVTVDFIETNGWTEVRLRHEGFDTEDMRNRHNEGWSACFDKLEKLFRS